MIKRYFSLVLLILVTFCGIAQANNERSTKLLNQEQMIRLSQAINKVKTLYYQPISDKEIADNAIRGMLQYLDPHSLFLDEEELRALSTTATGKFVGVGLEIVDNEGKIKVVTPIDDTPADKAGIKPGDYILAIDGQAVIGMPLTKAVKLIRGKAGTTVTLVVANKKDLKPRRVKITRQLIKIESVKYRLLPDNYGYIRITHFQEKTEKQVIAAIESLNKKSDHQLKGLVLDLRNNPGGLLLAGAEVSDLFLDRNKLTQNYKIVYTKGRKNTVLKQFDAKAGDILYGKPMVILINEGTASAAEVVAGALQDHYRAVLVGERSFGKGSVQSIFPLGDNTGMKLTTALYYTPKGRSIQARGIQPDVVVDSLKVPENGEELEAIEVFRESNLYQHLENGTKKEKIKATQAQINDLVYKDYQLYNAINILKSMRLLSHQAAAQA